ncbi:MAG TPA: 2TM domain-containing protein, partial [Bacteroidales bacterium]|nr:2TM domain-containing protein [Bacteroidales bacterium]
LWKKANERAGFKMHLIVYIIAILFMWILWAFIGYVNDISDNHKWPLYPMLAWALILVLHYFIVFRWKNKLTQIEYNKLQKKSEKKEINN